ncbi:MAG: hypothetical protein ABI151_11205 [Chitinophagaceae bacterium]
MNEKKSRTAIQQKIDSRLLQAVKENRGEKKTTPEPVNVGADKSGNLTVDIDTKVSDTLLDQIRSQGGTIISSFKEYDAIRVLINLCKIEAIAAIREVKFIKPAALAQTNKIIKPVEGTDPQTNTKPA